MRQTVPDTNDVFLASGKGSNFSYREEFEEFKPGQVTFLLGTVAQGGYANLRQVLRE